ncbi:MAG TPA: ABC transporter substrate-binding protein [Patescibacteria group bacterium]|nr:ABC transporter substrate-binding protein [Patescibacteria group bacterium]
MIVFNKRLIFWLIKAYFKKSWKMLILFFLLGLSIFFAILFSSHYISQAIPVFKKQSIGVIGAYRQTNLPPIITNKFSRGLTRIDADGSVKPDLAEKWEVKDSGKTYVFHLKKDQYFSDGKNVTSDKISYNFSDVTVERPDEYTIIFKLKEPYAPFLITVAKGVFAQGNVGISDYKIEDIDLNGDFVQSLSMVSVKNRFDTIRFQFYPSEEALKLAFLLGEISEANGLTNSFYTDIDLSVMPNASAKKVTNYSRLVTLFYNTTDSTLSDRIVRIALSYALPDTYQAGEKTYFPYSPKSIFYNHSISERKQDFEHAIGLLDSAQVASEGGKLSLSIKTLQQYRQTADLIAREWEKAGIETTVEEVSGIPDTFQIFLGDFSVPQDPDQYSLWHSGQNNNITRYRNLRIDKLLEDGRKTVNESERKSLYADFQRFLMEDVPASFLYFPYEYDIIRK